MANEDTSGINAEVVMLYGKLEGDDRMINSVKMRVDCTGRSPSDVLMRYKHKIASRTPTAVVLSWRNYKHNLWDSIVYFETPIAESERPDIFTGVDKSVLTLNTDEFLSDNIEKVELCGNPSDIIIRAYLEEDEVKVRYLVAAVKSRIKNARLDMIDSVGRAVCDKDPRLKYTEYYRDDTENVWYFMFNVREGCTMTQKEFIELGWEGIEPMKNKVSKPKLRLV